jgi:hypothetical protein
LREWWAAVHSYMGHMLDKTRDQMNNWRWDNCRAFGDQVDHSNPQKTNFGEVKCTAERFSWYGSDDLKAKIEPPSCQQYKPDDIGQTISRSGTMAASEWTRSVRAIRDTPVADCSTPGINIMRCVVYRPPITVSLPLRVQSVSYFRRSLWHCGQR